MVHCFVSRKVWGEKEGLGVALQDGHPARRTQAFLSVFSGEAASLSGITTSQDNGGNASR